MTASTPRSFAILYIDLYFGFPVNPHRFFDSFQIPVDSFSGVPGGGRMAM